MHDPQHKRAAIPYWEKRRILYNAALIPPTFLGYMLACGIIYVGDPHKTYPAYVLFLLTVSAVGANVSYSLIYALEFLFGSNDPASRWVRVGRSMCFVGGCLVAMMLAFACA